MIANRALWVWVLAIFCSTLTGQNIPKVSFQELVFHSAFEQAQFELLRDGKPNAMGLMLSADSTANETTLQNIEQVIARFKASVPVEKLAKKGDDKVVKYVFDSGHAQYLNTYQLENYFTHIFENGKYNCVSASAFYYAILSQLGIPAQIHETPDHIYVVAYPKTLKILLETTDPLLGFQPLSSKYAKNYISILQAVKLVSEEELAGFGTDEAFEKLFFADKEVSLLDLAGIQYLNSGIYHLEAEQYRKSYNEFKKGLYLYPDSRSQAMMLYSIAYLIETEGYTKQNIALLADYVKYGNLKNPAEEMIAEFGSASYRARNIVGDVALIDTMYHILFNALTDSSAKSGLDFIYNYNKAVDYQIKAAYKLSQTHAMVSYAIRPTDEDLRAVITQNLTMINYGSNDFEMLVKAMEKDLIDFPFVAENGNYTGQLCMVYLGAAGTNFEMGSASKALAYLKKFEEFHQENMNINQEFVGLCYGAASAYYFKQGNDTKAKALVKKGLTYAPGNYELTRRLKALE